MFDDPSAVRRFLHADPDRHVLVLGDVVVDRYVPGDVDRIADDAPVPVLRVSGCWELPGAAANVAVCLARLGARVTLLGVIGDDVAGAALRRELVAHDIGCEALHAVEGSATATKTRFVGNGSQLLRVDSRHPPCTDADLASVEAATLRYLATGRISAVVLADYGGAVLDGRVCGSVIRECARRGITVIADPKYGRSDRFAGADILTPSVGELRRSRRGPALDVDTLLDFGRRMLGDTGAAAIAVKRGPEGILLVQADRAVPIAGIPRQVVDTCGAGDVVSATLAVTMAHGIAIADSVRLANLCAALRVAKAERSVSRGEAAAAIGNLEGVCPVLTEADELMPRVGLWRSAGESVVFTNGCFDVLHIGHLHVLEQARKLGDRLVIALNSDASVRRLKGSLRPVNCLRSRARIIAALGLADAIVEFSEDTPVELIRRIRPTHLVKGGDYDPRTVVGAAEVASWGGDVHIIPLIAGVSTTTILSSQIRGTPHASSDAEDGGGAAGGVDRKGGSC